MSSFLSSSSSYLSPSGSDDKAALQAVLDAGLPLILKAGATFRLSSALSIPANARIASSDPNNRATIQPLNWAPGIASQNDPSVAMVTATATIANSGTT